MTNEELILQKLGAIEAELMEIKKTREPLAELVSDMEPLMKSSFQHLLHELGKVDHGFQLEDGFLLLKRFLSNMNNMAMMLDTMDDAIEAFHTMEPMLKSMVHQGIRFLGTLEQRGVFRTYEAMLDVRAKVAQQYGPEEIEAMSDSFVQLLGLLKKMATPEFVAFLGKMAEIPAAVDFKNAQPLGLKGMVKAATDPGLREGLGVGLELAKALQKLK